MITGQNYRLCHALFKCVDPGWYSRICCKTVIHQPKSLSHWHSHIWCRTTEELQPLSNMCYLDLFECCVKRSLEATSQGIWHPLTHPESMCTNYCCEKEPLTTLVSSHDCRCCPALRKGAFGYSFLPQKPINILEIGLIVWYLLWFSHSIKTLYTNNRSIVWIPWKKGPVVEKVFWKVQINSSLVAHPGPTPTISLHDWICSRDGSNCIAARISLGRLSDPQTSGKDTHKKLLIYSCCYEYSIIEIVLIHWCLNLPYNDPAIQPILFHQFRLCGSQRLQAIAVPAKQLCHK